MSPRIPAIACLVLVCGLSACGPPRSEQIEAKATPPRADHLVPIGPEPEAIREYHVGEMRAGDSLSVALGRFKLGAPEIEELVLAFKGLVDFRRARTGDVFEFKKGSAPSIAWFRYASGPMMIASAFRGSDGVLKACLEPIAVTTTTVTVEGRIEHSLYVAMESAGEEPTLTLEFVDVFAWDVDFFTETQPGDRFKIVVEKRYIDGKFVAYGKILGAIYEMASGRAHSAFYYSDAAGHGGYYTKSGESVQKAFLKSPIQFASITSRYGMRRHPILRYVRAHQGVDYGAPQGTAIWAVGDGVVTYAGWKGGYGRVAFVRHRNGLETRYAHLSGHGRGIHTGVRVAQKQVIGYVGKTGLATGPHLHFEVLQAGRHVNPLRMAAPPAPPIPSGERVAFQAQIAPTAARLDHVEARVDAAPVMRPLSPGLSIE